MKLGWTTVSNEKQFLPLSLVQIWIWYSVFPNILIGGDPLEFWNNIQDGSYSSAETPIMESIFNPKPGCSGERVCVACAWVCPSCPYFKRSKVLVRSRVRILFSESRVSCSVQKLPKSHRFWVKRYTFWTDPTISPFGTPFLGCDLKLYRPRNIDQILQRPFPCATLIPSRRNGQTNDVFRIFLCRRSLLPKIQHSLRTRHFAEVSLNQN